LIGFDYWPDSRWLKFAWQKRRRELVIGCRVFKLLDPRFICIIRKCQHWASASASSLSLLVTFFRIIKMNNNKLGAKQKKIIPRTVHKYQESENKVACLEGKTYLGTGKKRSLTWFILSHILKVWIFYR